MYGLPQAGILANQLLQTRLAQHGYYPVRHTPGYWCHHTKPTSFVLVVDDFSVKYVHKADADDLLQVLRTWYKVKVDWSASLNCGITTHWDYDTGKVTLSMPGYVDKILRELKHPHPRRPQFAPYPHIPITYGKQPQLANLPDLSVPLPPDNPVQPSQIIGKLLYYARAVDSTLAVALSSLASEQNKPTLRTKQKILHLLDYCATNPLASLVFHASDMSLHVHSDAGYNNEAQACSRAGGHLFLAAIDPFSEFHNGAVFIRTHILKHVLSSAADVEIGAAFVNCREAIPLRTTLAEMGGPQPPTTVTLDNTTAVSFVNKHIKQGRTKAVDMRYYWLQDQESQEFFKFIWKKAVKI